MTQKRLKPAPLATGTGLGISKTSTVFDREISTNCFDVQRLCAAEWLLRRIPMPLATARAVAEANGLGGAG